MSLKPKHTRLHDPKFREREPVEIPEPDERFDADALANLPVNALAPCENKIMAERLREALGG